MRTSKPEAAALIDQSEADEPTEEGSETASTEPAEATSEVQAADAEAEDTGDPLPIAA